MVSPRIEDFKVSGRLTADPQRVNAGGRDLVTFDVAENVRRFDRENNEWVDAGTNYYEVAVDAQNRKLGNLASNVESSLKQGNLVNISGNYRAEAYVNNEGQAQIAHRIWADDVTPSLKWASAQIEPNQTRAQMQQGRAEQQASAQSQSSMGSSSAAVQTYSPDDFQNFQNTQSTNESQAGMN